MKKISIIIPVYNAEKYLERCIDSILKQTYKNLEIILINDGSKDNSLNICNEYKKIDSRIQVINQTNHGVSYTRNKGLEVSTGDYIGFVDSDDIIHPRMYEILMEMITKENVSISEIRYNKYTNNCNFEIKDNYKKYTKEEAIKENLKENISNFLWDKLIKKELFNEISFKNNIIFEDLDIIYKLIDKSNSIVINESILYGYYQNETSYVHTIEKSKLINYYNVYLSKYNYLINKYPEYTSEINQYRIYCIFILYRNIVLSNDISNLKIDSFKKEQKRLKELIKTTKYKFSFIKKCMIKLLSLNGKLFYRIAYILYKVKEV